MVAALLGLGACATAPTTPEAPINTALVRAPVTAPQADDLYYASGAAALKDRLARAPNTRRAKNVILFVGDGMGIATVTAARIRAGQRIGRDGESFELEMDRFHHSALVKTYSHDYQVSDSASTATALVSGVKTRSGVIGHDHTVERGVCPGADAARATSFVAMAEAAGLATGVVSTTRLTHATPAAVYGHAADRDWETDRELGEAAALGCRDLAEQLVTWPVGDGLEVALGGGRSRFLPRETADPEDAGAMGARTDGRDLTAEWTARSPSHAYVWRRAEFDAVDWGSDARVLGLFERSHMEFEVDRARDTGGEPSLAAMTTAAITRLSQDPDGFVLVVESGRIDHAHHAGQARRALEETIAFDEAITAALGAVDPDETLIVVTADHAHTLTIAGYAARGTDILDLARDASGAPLLAADGKPYTTLGYLNGPGSPFPPAAAGRPAPGPGPRPDLTTIDVTDLDYRQQALVPSYSETHAGEDVAVFARGPWSHVFAGVIEQHVVFHIIAHAADLGRRRAGETAGADPAS